MKVELSLTPKEKQIFLKELDQHIQEIEQGIVNLEQNENLQQAIEQLFRSFHTIKGNAGIAEYGLLKSLSHEVENSLQKFRNSTDPIPAPITEILFKSIDHIKILREPIVNPAAEVDETAVNNLITLVQKTLAEVMGTTQKASEAVATIAQTATSAESTLEVYVSSKEMMPAVRFFQVLTLFSQANLAFHSAPTLAEVQAAKAANPLKIMLKSDLISPDITNKIMHIDGINFVRNIPPLKTYTPNAKSATSMATQHTQEELQDVQINIKKLDSLINLLGEILIDRNKIAQNILELEEKYTLDPQIAELLDLVNHLGKITYNLQTELLNIRTIPLSNIVGKYPRLIREMAKNLGKKVRLEITGQQVELDRLILKYLNDMLIHLIRNSIDHGVETPEKRIQNNKKDIGLIRIDAYQKHNKAFFVITDDGAGIDPKQIKKKLLEKDILDADTANSLSSNELIKYIFHPGFSTKEEVSEISGRGVGMDVVQNTIQKLGGQIAIESEVGKGSQFKIILPLTLAIVQGLVTTSHNRTFIIPISYVDEVVRCYGREVRMLNQKPHLFFRGNLIPLIHLKSLLYDQDSNIKKEKKLFIVIVNYNDHQTGIIVDKLIGEEEIVIKNIDYAADKYYIIHSATIMGTGNIGLILDIASLLDFVTMGKKKAVTTTTDIQVA